MMNCEDARPRLDRYLDGELSDEEEDNVRRHLRHCDDCARAARERKTVGTILESHHVPGPPESLKESIMDKVNTRDNERVEAGDERRNVPVNRLAAAAVFLVGLLLGLSVHLWIPGGPQSGRQLSNGPSRPPLIEVQPVGSLSELVNPQIQKHPGGQL